jgi:DUF2891 family protein
VRERLRARAGEFARVALANVRQEYPNDLRHTLTGPDDRPRPRELHPSFYGSFDWHSCVEMHWVLLRLLRFAPEAVPAAEIRSLLDEHLAVERLAVEAAYLADPAHRTFQRPYGRSWALLLAHEAATWDDPDARRWSANLAELAATIGAGYLDWLPRATYPVRYGFHNNSAFGLSRALPWAAHLARSGDEALLAAVTDAAIRWFHADRDYPAAWEPAGSGASCPGSRPASRRRCSRPRRSRTQATATSPTCTASTSAARGAWRRSPASCPRATSGCRCCARRRPGTPTPPSTRSAAATTWSSTGWSPTPCSC